MLDLSTNLPCEDMPTKSEETNPWTVEKSWLGIEASHFSSISLTLIFFPLGAAAVVGAAGFVAVVVVASFFGAVGEVAAGRWLPLVSRRAFPRLWPTLSLRLLASSILPA